MSMTTIAAAGPCGRGVTRPAWWIASAMCSGVIAISNSTRCVPGWSWTRLTTADRVIGETPGAERALGSERFKDEIEAALHRKVRPGKAGRLRKKTQKAD